MSASESTTLPVLDEPGRRVLFLDARTVNNFSAEPVTDEQLREIWSLAKWPPTSANTQPLRVVYVRTQEGKERVVRHMMEGNQAKTASAPAVAVLAADRAFHEHMPTVFPQRPGMKDFFEEDEGRRQMFSSFNSTLQAAYFILATRAVGLAAGPMGGFDAEGMDKEFFPDGRYHSILVVNIGHPGENPWFDRLPRLGDDQVITWA